MLEAVWEVGRLATEHASGGFLENLCLEIDEEQGGKKQHVVIIDFATDNNSLKITPKQITPGVTEKEYLWVGNADGSSSPQWYLTTNNLSFLVSQTFPNLLEVLPKESELAQKVQKVLAIYFIDTGEKGGAENRYRYLLNLEMLPGYKGSKLLDLIKENPKGKNLAQVAAKEFSKWLKEQTGLSEKEIALYTVYFDGQKGVDYREYQEKVEAAKVFDIFAGEEGVCHACGNFGLITSDTTKLKFKYYITDKIGYASNHDKKNFYKNYSLCPECYKKLLIAESFIQNKFNNRLGNLNLFIIPGFLFPVNLKKQQFHKWMEFTNNSFNNLKGYNEIAGYEQMVSDYFENREIYNQLIFNFLFYQKNKAEFKVLKLIKDIPPSRILKILQLFQKVNEVYKKHFNQLLPELSLNLNRIYYQIPQQKGKTSVEYRKFLDLLESIFTGHPVEKSFIIRQHIELFKIFAFTKEGFNVNPGSEKYKEIELAKACLRANLLNLFLQELEILPKEVDAVELELDLKAEDLEYIREMGYTPQQAALFLLGVLVGEIASAQHQSNLNKAILNKLTYQGMSLRRIISFANEVHQKLFQYKKLNAYTEKIYNAIKSLLDKEIPRWSLSDQENVFYLLSGYSYLTGKILSRAKIEKAEVEGM